MAKYLILLLAAILNLSCFAGVDVLVSKNHRGNTQNGAYRKGGIVEVRPAGMPIGNKEPIAFYLIHVSDADSVGQFSQWLEVDKVSVNNRGRRTYRLKTSYLNGIDTYDTLTFADFAANVVPKDVRPGQGMILEGKREMLYAGIIPDLPKLFRWMIPGVTLTTATVITTGGGDYTSLNAAEAGEQKDLVAANEQLTINCSGTSADVTAVTFAGWTTSSSAYVLVQGDNTSGIWNTNFWHMTGSTAMTFITVSNAYMQFKNIYIKHTANVNFWRGVYFDSNGDDCVLDKFHIWAEASGTNSNGVRIDASNVDVRNGIVHGLYTHGGNGGIAAVTFGGSANVYNVVAYNNYYNFRCIYGVVKNSISQSGAVDGNYKSGSDFILTDRGAGDAPGANSINGVSVTFTDAAGGDFSLASGSRGIDEGTDLSGDGVTTDIKGVSRPQGSAYDMGAFEFVPAAVEESTDNRFKKWDDWQVWKKW